MAKPERTPSLSQLEKFKETARELGASDSERAFDDKLRKIVRAPPAKTRRKKKPGK
jgi:hypothetical protein